MPVRIYLRDGRDATILAASAVETRPAPDDSHGLGFNAVVVVDHNKRELGRFRWAEVIGWENWTLDER